MKKKVLSMLGVVALAIGVAMFVAPPASQAITITSVSVTVGGTTWCDTTSACASARQIWDLGGGVALPNPGDFLILAQTKTSPFNFDTSEGNLPGCSSTTPCNTSVTINGVLVVNSAANSILANANKDPGTAEHNEATDYALAASVPSSFNLFFGYADNVHTDACADADKNCLPEPFGGPFALGSALPGGFVETNPNHCTASLANCFDSGVLEIVAVQRRVPEASTLLLLGTGLIGVAAWRRRHLLGKI